MPISSQHDITDLRDVVVGNSLVEEVAHGIDENPPLMSIFVYIRYACIVKRRQKPIGIGGNPLAL
jgi:hypothetical protein